MIVTLTSLVCVSSAASAEVPGVREILEEDNRWDMKLYRYLHDELWEDYKRQVSASEAPGR